MVGRYLAIVGHRPMAPAREGPHERALAAGRKAGLRTVHDSPRLTVLAGPTSVPIGAAGVLLGTLFTRDTAPTRVHRLPAAGGEAVAASGGRVLLDRYWGGYVALWDHADAATPMALRDPSGAAPAYAHSDDQITLLASDITLLFAALGGTPSIDWSYVAINACNLMAAPQATAFEGIHELPPGHVARLGSATSMAMLWSPWEHARRAHAAPAGDLAARIAETTLACVGAWGRLFSHASVGVSGGLDSSIVAAGLTASATAVTAYTMASDDADGDERAFARILAQGLDIPLHERFYQLAAIDVQRSSAAHLPRPLSNYVAQALGQESDRLHRELGVDAHFSGSGGDNIFCLLHSAAPIVDQARAGASPAALWRSVRDLSKLTTASAFDIGRLALAHAHGKTQYRPALTPHRFVRLDGNRHLRDRFAHPWLQAPADIPPGKARHVALIAMAELGVELDPTRGQPPVILPLLSQPLVELCLATPAWVWFAGGINRAPARAAFADRLPRAILQRTSKGGPSRFLDQIYAANRPTITAMLREGRLASAGVIDGAAVQTALSGDAPLSRPEIRQLLGLASVEAWVRAWT